MLRNTQFNSLLPDQALASFFSKGGDALADEARILGEVTQLLMKKGLVLSNKNLIIYLIKALESSDNIVRSDIIRNTLEIVLGYTADDLGINDNR